MSQCSVLRRYRLTLPLLALLLPGSGQASDLTAALTQGTPTLDLRLRYEHVDQDNKLDNADALTLRTRLGYRSGDFHRFSAFVEMENTSALNEDYNSGPGGNDKTRYAVVADPELSEINQAFVRFDGLAATHAILGRQRIILDNARFVGNVGWRQNEQTYDALRISDQNLPHIRLDYAYLTNVRNVFGNDTDTSSQLFNVRYTGLGFASLTAYGYLIDFNDSAEKSQQTYGLRLRGSSQLSSVKILYTAETAHQGSYRDGNHGIDGNYRLLEAGLSAAGITGKAAYELLGADDFSGFETPFATKHGFNGWADVFLNTPTDGLQDIYLSLAGKISGVRLLGVYHDFQADKGGMDYGTEIDLLATRKFGRHYQLGLKYARYDADRFAVDTDKFWLWGQLKL